jgi:hypothetical protein
MTSYKSNVQIQNGFILLFLSISIHCSWGAKNNVPDPSLNPINPKDQLPIQEIVRIKKNGTREILSTSPEAMRYIFYKAGCSDGTPLAGLMEHNWNSDSKVEEWKGACKSLKYDSILFRVTHPGNLAKYKEFSKVTYPLLEKAEKKQDVNYYMQAIEYEPALADARLALFKWRTEHKECKKAKRELTIFLNLSPGFIQKRSLESFYKKICGSL